MPATRRLRRFDSEKPLAAEAGANALAASSDDPEAFTDARRAAKTLVDKALTTQAKGERTQTDNHVESKVCGRFVICDRSPPRVPVADQGMLKVARYTHWVAAAP